MHTSDFDKKVLTPISLSDSGRSNFSRDEPWLLPFGRHFLEMTVTGSSEVTSLMTLTICLSLLLTSLLLVKITDRSDINRSDKQMVSH